MSNVQEIIAHYLIHSQWQILKDLNAINLRRLDEITKRPNFKQEINDAFLDVAKEIIAIKIGQDKGLDALTIYTALEDVDLKKYLEIE